MAKDDLDELRGEIVALETALAAMEEMATQLEGSVLRGVVGAERIGRPDASAGFERRMEQIAHALRNAIAFRDG